MMPVTNKIERFEDLEVWRLGVECADLIYQVTSTGKFSQDYVLRDQIRRSGVSIFSNVAEGFERDGNKELCNFLTIAKGSCGEARAQMIFAYKLGYVSTEDYKTISEKLTQTSRQLSGFRSYLRRSDMKGRKFD
jgi:four helix bundle protein